jgi:repressor LexA
MTRGLTKRQQQIYEFLLAYQLEHGYPPTLREICHNFGMASTRAASDHLEALDRKGMIKREADLSRGIKFTDQKRLRTGRSLPLVGRVAAGAPLLAFDDVTDYITLDESLTRHENSFMLEVQGESMIGAHILDGDFIIVKRQETANDGEIVVALLGDEATVKRLEKRGSKIRLIPENPTMSPIPVPRPEELRIVGIVTGLVRKM